MAAAGYTPIQIYYSTTASAVPSAGDLITAEFAVNVTDKKLYTKDGGGNVITLVGTLGNQNANAVAITGGSITGITDLAVADGGTGASTAAGARVNLLAVGYTATTGSAILPTGTTAERDGSPLSGYLRFNTTTSEFEGYNGTTWSSVGGAAISNDTSTSSDRYPLFASATTGTATTVYTSNAKYLYKPSTGDLQASQVAASNGLVLNNATISTSYTIASGYNAMSTGPVSIASGVTVTVSSGSRYIVL